jgi:hypothetical protein
MTIEPKSAYISPPTAELSVSVIRGARPEIQIFLDLGIPNFTVFSIKFPFVEDEKTGMADMTTEAMLALLEEVSAFMISMEYAQPVCVELYSLAMACFNEITAEKSTQVGMSDVEKDNGVQTFTAKFNLPLDFVDETQEKVVLASTFIERSKPQMKFELTSLRPVENTLSDAGRVIRMFRTKTISQQPHPLYLIVYNQQGKGIGTINLKEKEKFKNPLLTKRRGRK